MGFSFGFPVDQFLGDEVFMRRINFADRAEKPQA
jgi:hypothetical protein